MARSIFVPDKMSVSHPVMGGIPIKPDKLSGVKFISGQMKGAFNSSIIQAFCSKPLFPSTFSYSPWQDVDLIPMHLNLLGEI